MARQWMVHRQAWTPRCWPMVLATMIAAGLASLAIRAVFDGWPELIAAVLVPFVIGITFTAVPWWLWRRRHPVISPEEYLAVIRREAPWN